MIYFCNNADDSHTLRTLDRPENCDYHLYRHIQQRRPLAVRSVGYEATLNPHLVQFLRA